MKRKAMGRARPVSRGGFSLNGGHRNRGGIGRPTFVSHCSANDSSIIKNSTKTSKGYEAQRLMCCKPVVNVVSGHKSHSEQLDAKVGNHIACQDTNPLPDVCAASYVERKNGKNGAAYESYEAYIRNNRRDCERESN